MLAQEEITQLKAKIARLETKLWVYEEQRASCTCIANLHTDISDEALSHYDAQLHTVQIPSLSLSNIRRSSVPPQSSKPSESSESAGSQGYTFLHCAPGTYAPSTLNLKRARKSASSNSSQLPHREAAGRLFTLSVKSNKYNTNMLCTPRMEPTEPTEPTVSAYDSGTKIAQDTATMLQNADLANAMASMGLFYFLSSLHVLQQLGMLSMDQADELMNHLDAKLNNLNHRRRIRAGAIWFHKKVISIVCSQGWELGHAIAVVAISGFSTRS
jgi:hypothetical protein